jgi:hypothetical protein
MMFDNIKFRRRAVAAMAGLLVAIAMSVAVPSAATAQSPKVNIYGVDVPTGDLLKQIEAQCGYTFAYNMSALDLSKPVTLHATNSDIEVVLRHILRGTGYTYILREMHILILPVSEYVRRNRRTTPVRPVAAHPATPPVTPVIPAAPVIAGTESNTDSEINWIYRQQQQSATVVTGPPVPETPQTTVPQVVDVVPPTTVPQTVVETTPPTVAQEIPATPVTPEVPATPVTETPVTPVVPVVPETPAAPSPLWAVKTNLLFDATTTMNLGFELRIAPQWTVELTGSYNPWSWADNRKWKSIVVQPEFRYWINGTPFKGHFIGVHAHWAHYNFGNLPFGQMKSHRYQGDLGGVGFSYGHSWPVAPRWTIEATLGAGYAYMDYQRFDGMECGTCYGWENRHYIGVTKLGVSLSYIIK